MRTGDKIIMVVVAAVVALLLVGLTVIGDPSEHFRRCGHREDLRSRVRNLTGLPLGATHCCGVWSMYNDIRAISAGQEEYYEQHGSYSASLSDVTNYLGRPFKYRLELGAGDHEW